MSTIKDLSSEVDKRIQAKLRTGNITKESIEKMLDVNRSVHLQINKHINSFSVDDIVKIYDRMLNRKNDKSYTAVQVYFSFVASLPLRLRQMEEQRPFSSFAEINNKFINCYNDLMANFDKYIDIENLALPKTRLSHYLIIGLTDKSDFVSQFFFFLFDGITFDLIDSLSDKPKYRMLFLQNNVKKVAGIMDSIDKLGKSRRPVEIMINNLKKSGMNLVVVNENGENLTAYLRTGVLSKGLLSNITQGIKRVRFFGSIGEHWETFKYYWVVRRTKVNKEWMETQRQLLVEDLEDLDQNSKEYKRLLKIVENYSVEISKLDKRLQTYMDSD